MDQTALDTLESLKKVQTADGLLPAIQSRWSPRSFDQRPVPADALRLVLEAARWAASSGNEQPWRFLVAVKQDREAFARMLSVLVESNQAWAKTAPVLLLTVAKKEFSRGNKPNKHALHDTGAALATLSLQAVALGLRTHAMAGYDEAKARALLHIPDDFEIGAAVALGYLGSPEALPKDLRERELAERTRKPLSELVFGAEWNQPFRFDLQSE